MLQISRVKRCLIILILYIDLRCPVIYIMIEVIEPKKNSSLSENSMGAWNRELMIILLLHSRKKKIWWFVLSQSHNFRVFYSEKKWSQNSASEEPFWKTAPLWQRGAIFFFIRKWTLWGAVLAPLIFLSVTHWDGLKMLLVTRANGPSYQCMPFDGDLSHPFYVFCESV